MALRKPAFENQGSLVLHFDLKFALYGALLYFTFRQRREQRASLQKCSTETFVFPCVCEFAKLILWEGYDKTELTQDNIRYNTESRHQPRVISSIR